MKTKKSVTMAMDKSAVAAEKKIAKAVEAFRVGLENSGMSGELLEEAVERYAVQRRRMSVFDTRLKSLTDAVSVPTYFVAPLFGLGHKAYGLARRMRGPLLASRIAAYAATLVREGVPEEAVQTVMERSWEILTKAEAGKDSEMLRKCLRDSLQPA
jgi:hypothetical protein